MGDLDEVAIYLPASPQMNSQDTSWLRDALTGQAAQRGVGPCPAG